MIRDRIKNKTYFDDFIEKRKQAILVQNSNITDFNFPINRLHIAKKVQSDLYGTLLKAKYSRGDYMFSEDVKKLFLEMVRFWCEARVKHRLQLITYLKNKEVVELNQYTFSGYIDILDILSFSVLLDIPTHYFRMIADIISKDDVKDFLINFLLKFKLKGLIGFSEESYNDEKYLHINKRLGALKKIINMEDKATANKELKSFLEKKWYSSLKDTGYYNQHKNPHNTYTGYWCFVAAAIVKIKGLDDSSFKDNEYYPKDMLNQ